MRLTAVREVKWNESAPQTGLTFDKVFMGPEPHGLGGIQVSVVKSDVAPTRQVLRELHVARRGKTNIQLVVAVINDGATHLIGPNI